MDKLEEERAIEYLKTFKDRSEFISKNPKYKDWLISNGYKALLEQAFHSENYIEGNHFQNNLIKLMHEKKLTLLSLANLSGVSKSTIHDWKKGAEPKVMGQVKKVCDVLGVDVSSMWLVTIPKSRSEVVSAELISLLQLKMEILKQKIHIDSPKESGVEYLKKELENLQETVDFKIKVIEGK